MNVMSFAHLLRVAPRTVSRWELAQAAPPRPQRRWLLERIGPLLGDEMRASLAAALGYGDRARAGGGEPAGGEGAPEDRRVHEDARPLGASGPAEFEARIRASLDAVVRAEAEALDVPARRLRRALGAVLEELARLDLGVDAARAYVLPLAEDHAKR
jgi:hypothetical protein